MKKVSILGPSSATKENLIEAERLGRFLAEEGIKVQNGGYNGVMEASAKGTVNAGGQCHGILMDANPKGNEYLTSCEVLPLWERTAKLLSEDCIAIWSTTSLGTQWEILTAIIASRFGLPNKKLAIICSPEEEVEIRKFYPGKETSRIFFTRTAAMAVTYLI